MTDQIRTDEQLYRDYLHSGDASYLHVLVERYHDSLTFFLLGILRNREDAEDLMVETFAQLLSKDKHFKGESSFKTYLFAIGRNLAYKHFRKNRQQFIQIDDNNLQDFKTAGLTPEQLMINQESIEQLYQSLQKLHKDYRDALLLTYFEELSYKETAVILGKSEKQITNLVYRGKKALKEIMEKEEH